MKAPQEGVYNNFHLVFSEEKCRYAEMFLNYALFA